MAKHKRRARSVIGIVSCLTVFMLACNKNTDSYSGAYKDAVVQPILFENLSPVPASGTEGQVIKFKIIGLDSLKKLYSKNPEGVKFFLNGIESAIDSITPEDSTISVTIPPFASSGSASILIGGDTFFGPQLKIRGNASIDSTFNVELTDQQGRVILGTGTNGTITRLFFDNAPGESRLFLAGSFTSYNDKTSYLTQYGNKTEDAFTSYLLPVNPVSGAVLTNFTKGSGPNGPINGILPLTQFPGYLVYGANFSVYRTRDGVNNMTRIYTDGKLDSVVRNVFNPTPLNPDLNVDTLPGFTGGYNSSVIRCFLDAQQRIISIGGFKLHAKNQYDLSTFYNVSRSYSVANGISAQDQAGNLDETYNFDATGKNYTGANGAITDAVQLLGSGSAYGKIIVTGAFTSYNGISKSRIMMLDNNGQPDPAFTAGANGTITRITYNKTTRKLLVTGSFSIFNGTPAPAGLVMLNEDGTRDDSFSPGEFVRSNTSGGQLVTFAGQMDNGRVIVAGNFEKYKEPAAGDYITRQGFMILNSKGALVPALNNLGAFRGTIYDFVETVSADNKKALILAGNFTLFDNTPVGNIIKLRLQPK